VSEPQEKLPRSLGVWGIWVLAVNGLIGAGIFGLPSIAARFTGVYSPLIFVLCAFLILPIVLCFAELASYFRSTGGPIRYSTEAFGPFIGFQSGWLYYMARVGAFAANSALLVDNVGYFWPVTMSGGGRVFTLALVCGGLTFINIIGSVKAVRSLTMLTVLKLTVLVLLVGVGSGYLGLDVVPRFGGAVPTVSDIGAAALLLTYAYGGFEYAVIPAGEARNPARDMPLALLLALGVVALLYVLIQMVSLAAVPNIAESTAPLLDTANALIGPVGAMVLVIGVIASVGGNLVAGVFSTPRITYMLSLDGSLPRWFGVVDKKFRTPANSIVFFGLLSFSLAVFGSFIWLVATAVFSRLLVYMLTCGALPKLRKRYADKRGFVLPGGYLIPSLGIGASIWLTLQVSRESLILTVLLIAVGAVLYVIARRPRIAN
jgi:amino acid transporter